MRCFAPATRPREDRAWLDDRIHQLEAKTTAGGVV